MDKEQGASDEAEVLTKAVLRAAELLGLDRPQLARSIGIPEDELALVIVGEKMLRIGSGEAERAALLVRCYLALDALVGGSDEHRKAWMASYNRALRAKPSELVGHMQGLTAVVDYLDAVCLRS